LTFRKIEILAALISSHLFSANVIICDATLSGKVAVPAAHRRTFRGLTDQPSDISLTQCGPNIVLNSSCNVIGRAPSMP
jgi:hypothetical protein